MTDKRFLEHTNDEHVKADMDPMDVSKLVRRVRKVKFFIRIEGQLITERNEDEGTFRCYTVGENLEVSAAQAQKVLQRWIEFNDRRLLKGEKPGRIEVCRLNDCLFIG